MADIETAPSAPASVERISAFAPLREPIFRNIWTASLFSNFGQLILGVGAAWEMTRLSNDPTMVALVQTALMLPLFLIAVPAGAIADMFDRRKTVLVGLGFSVVNAIILTVLAALGYSSPWVILAFCVLIGAGVALFGPAWQASIREQVSAPLLPAAVALGSVSYNIARSVGPALGGIIVVAAGAQAAFGVTAVSYLPILIAFILWKRTHIAPSRLPPERIDRAMLAGMRYARHSPPIRTVLIRTFLFGFASASYAALAALIARDQLHGNASMFGILLGASGLGAVAGALMIGRAREWPGPSMATQMCTVATSIALVLIGLSHNAWLTGACFFVSGGANILMIGLLNINVQLSAPRWVTARMLSLFTSSITGGAAIGAVVWGRVAADHGVDTALVASGGVLALTGLVALLLPLRDRMDDLEPGKIRRAPQVGLDISLRSGPIAIEIDYYVDPDQARDFYTVMLGLQKSRQRNGGFNWTIARDIGDPSLWTERFECPTWGDYLRLRERQTQADNEAHEAAEAFSMGGERKIRMRLERPFGSVRWRAETPDPKQDSIPYIAP